MKDRFMKSLATASICLVVGGSALIGGVAMSSDAFRDPPPHHFANLDAPLWTTIPTRVDPKTQDYQRLPPLAADDGGSSVTPANLAGIAAIAPPVAAEIAQVDPVQQEWTADSRHIDLCRQRYRSYNTADNTYQPFDGSPRKPCITEEEQSSAETPIAVKASDSHISWCAARYSSYRASDNTYQPFSGQRRQCVSPLV